MNKDGLPKQIGSRIINAKELLNIMLMLNLVICFTHNGEF